MGKFCSSHTEFIINCRNYTDIANYVYNRKSTGTQQFVVTKFYAHVIVLVNVAFC